MKKSPVVALSKVNEYQHGTELQYNATLQFQEERLSAFHEAHRDLPSYFPKARSLKRKLTMFCGPTNCGKTWRALNELCQWSSGLYLAPLRLLALEGKEDIESRGKNCSFLTGEERDIRKDATFTSSTIEMLNFDKEVDAVLIDEVQCLADKNRGWAWTQAVVGAPAKNVYMTGSLDIVPALRELAATLGEELEVIELSRLTPFEVMNTAVSISDLTPGCAVIAFSRKDVLAIKALIEQSTDLRASVIYGNLSPTVRREEARRFRDGETQVLVSSDAIAMGLNLPIEKIIFFSAVKFDGTEERALTASEIRQIAGRAGRFGKFPKGYASALDPETLAAVKLAFADDLPKIEGPFAVMPDEYHARLISDAIGTNCLERVVEHFVEEAAFDHAHFVAADAEDLLDMSIIVDKVLGDSEMIETKMLFARTPTDPNNSDMVGLFTDMMGAYLSQDETHVTSWLFDVSQWKGAPLSPTSLLHAEIRVKNLTVYAWLSYRLPHIFKQGKKLDKARLALSAYIEECLRAVPPSAGVKKLMGQEFNRDPGPGRTTSAMPSKISAYHKPALNGQAKNTNSGTTAGNFPKPNAPDAGINPSENRAPLAPSRSYIRTDKKGV